MKKTLSILVIILIAALNSNAQLQKRYQLKKDPWNKDELIAPATLAALIKKPKASQPIIFNIGVVENIKGARHIGKASDKENLERFRKALSSIPKSNSIVVYCGCCPFDRCPNIRPAFEMLKTQGFKNGKLLNLPTNIKVDWIDKGYPIE